MYHPWVVINKPNDNKQQTYGQEGMSPDSEQTINRMDIDVIVDIEAFDHFFEIHTISSYDAWLKVVKSKNIDYGHIIQITIL